MTTYDKDVFSTSDDIEQDLTEEEKAKIEIELVKAISKKESIDNNINVSLIAYNELESIGFKNDVSTVFLSKLVEDLYHERKAYDSSDYFDLSMDDNAHYSKLVDYFIIGNEQFYKIMLDKAIKESECETEDINEIVYGVVGVVSNKINNRKKIKLEA